MPYRIEPARGSRHPGSGPGHRRRVPRRSPRGASPSSPSPPVPPAGADRDHRVGSSGGSPRSRTRSGSRAATPSAGAAPYAPEPTTPEMNSTPSSTIGSARRVAREGRSPSASHAMKPTTRTWRLPRTVARPTPTAAMAMVPEHQVAHEEDPGDRGQADRPGRQRPVLAPLDERDEHEDRQPEQGPEHGPGRGRDGRVQVEDPRERDADRAEQRRQPGPRREPVQRSEPQPQACVGRVSRSRRSLTQRAQVRTASRAARRSAGRVPRTGRAPGRTVRRASGRTRTASSGTP